MARTKYNNAKNTPRLLYTGRPRHSPSVDHCVTETTCTDDFHWWFLDLLSLSLSLLLSLDTWIPRRWIVHSGFCYKFFFSPWWKSVMWQFMVFSWIFFFCLVKKMIKGSFWIDEFVKESASIFLLRFSCVEIASWDWRRLRMTDSRVRNRIVESFKFLKFINNSGDSFRTMFTNCRLNHRLKQRSVKKIASMTTIRIRNEKHVLVSLFFSFVSYYRLA